MTKLLTEVRKCEICAKHLPAGPRPILIAHPSSRILIIGQAPGRRVHETGIAWNDPSGDRLRDWLGVTKEKFYNPHLFALIPMGFCYPGKGRSGDLPPRPECAEKWHEELFARLKNVRLTILLSQFAQVRYLGDARKATLTETVRAWKNYLPHYLPLPHPSPRNNVWLKKNPWFADEVLPFVRKTVISVLR